MVLVEPQESMWKVDSLEDSYMHCELLRDQIAQLEREIAEFEQLAVPEEPEPVQEQYGLYA
jgi:hypothetical protein